MTAELATTPPAATPLTPTAAPSTPAAAPSLPAVVPSTPSAAPSLPAAAPSPPGGVLVVERILRDRIGLWTQILEERGLNKLIGQLLVSSVAALACYGAVLGASSSFLQALSSAVKLPVLFLVTLAICMPTLYLFNLVFGARLSIRQAVALVLVAVAVISALSLAFAPISLFFLVTAPNYEFFKLLNVAILGLTGVVGVSVLLDGMRSLNKLGAAAHAPAAPQPAAHPQPQAGMPVPGPAGPHHPAMMQAPRPAEPRVNMGLLRIWALLFGFVGTQLAWTLRPFMGSPSGEFQIFRTLEGNFYVNIIETIGAWLS